MNTEEKFTLEDICIDDMLKNIFTSSAIKKKRKDIVSFYMQRLGFDLFGNTEIDESFLTEENVRKKVEAVLKEDKASEDPYLKYSNSLYQKKRNKATDYNTTHRNHRFELYRERWGMCRYGRTPIPWI